MVRNLKAQVPGLLGAALSTLVAFAVVTAGLTVSLSTAAQASTFTINTNIGVGYCSGSRMKFDYSVENVDYPGTPTVELLENSGIVLSLPVPVGGTTTGAYSTNLPIGSMLELQFRVDGTPIGLIKRQLVKNCLPPVRYFDPTPPSFYDVEGSQNDTVTIPTYEGVAYSINGQPSQAGTWPAQGKVTVTAGVATGYQFDGPQEATWTHTFAGVDNDTVAPKYDFPTPTVTFEKYHARKVAKTNRKFCTKLVRMRDDDYDDKDLTKRQYRALRSKCKLPYPRIQYSTRTTKVFEGIPYNWGVRPLTTGRLKMQVGRGASLLAYPGFTAVDPEVYEYIYDRAGHIKGYAWSGAWYMNPTRPYLRGRLDVAERVDQFMPYKVIPNQVVDSQIQQRFCNNSDRATTVTVGIKTHRTNPEIIAEDTFDLNANECRRAIVSDSAGLPPADDEYRTPESVKGRLFVHVNPDKQTSLKYRSEEKGIYYYRVNTDNPGGFYYQRSILIGVRNLRPGEAKPTMDAILVGRAAKKRMFRGW